MIVIPDLRNARDHGVDAGEWWIVEIVEVEGLVRLVGKRRHQQCAGRVRAANVVSGWVTPRRDAGIQARIATGLFAG